jgi:hypothetical protein
MMRMSDPFFAGTLTFVRMIETFVESAFVTVPKRFTVADHFFSFGEDSYVELHCIKSFDQRKINNKLKVIISPRSETKSESESFTILIYDNSLNSARELYSNGPKMCI